MVAVAEGATKMANETMYRVTFTKADGRRVRFGLRTPGGVVNGAIYSARNTWDLATEYAHLCVVVEPVGDLDAAAIQCGFRDFAHFRLDIIESQRTTSYSPSLYTSPRSEKPHHVAEAEAARVLADAYDSEMTRLGDARRAYRGGAVA